MHRFASLYERIDQTTSTDAKVAALKDYFASAPPDDAAWGLYFLTGQKMKRLVPTALLRAWCRERASVEPWLFRESYAVVGDLAETIALLIDAAPGLPESASSPEAGTEDEQQMLFSPDETDEPDDDSLHAWVEQRLESLRGLSPPAQQRLIDRWSRGLPRIELFLFIKMLTGSMRMGVSRTLVERALSELAGVSQAVIAHRLMGDWAPTPAFMRSLLDPDTTATDAARPYPFFLASPVAPPELPAEFVGTETDYVAHQLGDPALWLAEWKWDGIRAQLIKREHATMLWSRGDENLTERFPEIIDAAKNLPDGTVIDAELICWSPGDDKPLPFGILQQRIGRTNLSPEILRKAPARLIAYDLLENGGTDIREQPIEDRLAKLAELALLSPRETITAFEPTPFTSWADLAQQRATSRERGVEGVMLKRKGSPYQSGRRKGDWWKWKIDPLTIDAVLIYAQPGHGRRANLLTDYTFAVWDGDEPGQGELVTVAKAYSGLTDEEFAQLDRWLRSNTIERFGPARKIKPEQVFELAFEGVRPSTRHKSGVAFRFPRMKRWRHDKKPEDADTLATARSMIAPDDPGE